MSSGIKSYFERKKRDLSDKSNDGDERKKTRESSLDLSSSKVDDDSAEAPEVFSEGLDSPRWAEVLCKCLKDLERKVAEIRESQIKGGKQLEKVNESIQAINDKFVEFENEIKKKDEEIADLKKDVRNLTGKLHDVNNQLDRQEQYSRRNCLLLHGVDETDHEVTDDIIIKTIKDKMDVEITPESIDRTHRLGKKQQNTGRPRPIIVKFSTYNTRHKIFRNKKVLKGKGVSITESLTQKRVELLKKAREEHGFKSVWTQDGKILFVGNVDNKIKVYYD